MEESVRVELSRDEAFVLYEFLARFDEEASLTVRDQAEERALWNVHGLLETQLAELLDPNYDQRLAVARQRLRDLGE